MKTLDKLQAAARPRLSLVFKEASICARRAPVHLPLSASCSEPLTFLPIQRQAWGRSTHGPLNPFRYEPGERDHGESKAALDAFYARPVLQSTSVKSKTYSSPDERRHASGQLRFLSVS